MHKGLRSRKLVSYGAMLALSWSLMPMELPVAYSQPTPEQPVPVEPVPAEPIPSQQPPTTTPTEAEQTKEAEQLKKAEPTRAAEPETKIERKLVRPSETYVAGFGGYTFGGGLSDVEGTGLLSGVRGNDRDLADSVVYGGKVGHYFGDRLDWLGLEMEAYNTTPHVEQDGQLPGIHQRVTTLAFNVVGRLKFGCETKRERTETRTERAGTRTDGGTYMEQKDPTTGELYKERRDPSTGDIYRERRDPKTGELYVERRDAKTGEVIRVERDAKVDREIRYETHYEREFCRLQPYGGVGLGVFFAHLSNNGNGASDNAVPGFNALAGLRYFVTERIALFGEYKYNFAPFDYTADGSHGGGAGVKADYTINHVVGGLSFHF
ncbi:MAG: hypothetical protein CV088_06110 [Nitrospira sp. LK70]|nr:hypothetical protein [Nitrospira sp. LK70]